MIESRLLRSLFSQIVVCGGVLLYTNLAISSNAVRFPWQQIPACELVQKYGVANRIRVTQGDTFPLDAGTILTPGHWAVQGFPYQAMGIGGYVLVDQDPEAEMIICGVKFRGRGGFSIDKDGFLLDSGTVASLVPPAPSAARVAIQQGVSPPSRPQASGPKPPHGARAQPRCTPRDLAPASFQGDTNVLAACLRSGVDVDATEPGAITPLMVAAARGHLEALQLLAEKTKEIDRATSDGVTALMFAAHWGQKGAVEILVEKGAKVNTDDRGGQNAIDWAVSRADGVSVEDAVAAAKFLQSKGGVYRRRDGVGLFLSIGGRPNLAAQLKSVAQSSK